MNPDGSFSLSTWVTGLMFTGGLIAGPGYYFYCVAGSYTVRFRGSAPEAFGVRLSDARLHVRRNVKLPHMKTVWWGVGILVAGIVIGMFTGDVVPVKRNRDEQ